MSRHPLLLVLATVVTAVATGLGVAITALVEPVETSAATAPARPPLVEPVETTAARAPARPPLVEPVETSVAPAPARPPSLEPVELLRAWDATRARAWARGDPRLLRGLYTPGSVAGRRDLSMLRSWTARGLVVRQLRTQLLSVRELAHRRSAWTLLVTDRLAGGVAVGAGVRRPLPRDRATTRTIRLRRWAGRWRVASVRNGEVRP